MLIDTAFITVYNTIQYYDFCIILWYETMYYQKLFQTLDWCYEVNLERKHVNKWYLCWENRSVNSRMHMQNCIAHMLL